ncbi:calmodulin-like protein 7 [Gigantopelta aegis]|uniref:calmodulin-like protein 7 n=1 Tax=Gigantopelta aegis TaxID=1735272 RepID=UPI001B88801C|nr:calmodulin-like protein 7 [Gigantopelta aegis]
MLHANARIVLSVTLLHSYFLSSAVPFHNSLKKKSSADKSDLDPDLGHLPRNTEEAALEYYKQFMVDEGQHQGFGADDYEHQAEHAHAGGNSDDYDMEDQYLYPACMSIEYLTELKDRFSSQIDGNDDGKATYEEMLRHLRDYNPHVTAETVKKFIKRRDLNGNGVIEFVPEYIRNIVVPDNSEETAREWFALDDTNGDGYVTRDELLAITNHVGTPADRGELKVASYYMSNDKNGDDKLSWDEYKTIYGQ